MVMCRLETMVLGRWLFMIDNFDWAQFRALLLSFAGSLQRAMEVRMWRCIFLRRGQALLLLRDMQRRSGLLSKKLVHIPYKHTHPDPIPSLYPFLPYHPSTQTNILPFPFSTHHKIQSCRPQVFKSRLPPPPTPPNAHPSTPPSNTPLNNPSCHPNSCSRASPSPPPPRTGPNPSPAPPAAGPWTSPTPSSDSCNAASARNGHDSTATDGGRIANEGVNLEGKLIRLFYCHQGMTHGLREGKGRQRDKGESMWRGGVLQKRFVGCVHMIRDQYY